MCTPSASAAPQESWAKEIHAAQLAHAEFNRAFVLMQYFGYLRRDPNTGPDANYAGYNFRLGKLDQFKGDYIGAEMVKAFIVSSEYRQRFRE